MSHDVEASVKAIQAFTESYNSVMQWINARSSEKAVDETKKATGAVAGAATRRGGGARGHARGARGVAARGPG